jgi:stage II sporulation protein GA (sporulation sigma-E factor processing peptidase)
MVFYMDLIFLTNFLIDATILTTTAWARTIRVHPWRIVAASFIGAAYVVMMLFPFLSFLFTFMIKIVFSLLMIITAFGFGSLQHFLRNTATFYVINFVAAGGIFGIHYFLQSQSEVMNGIMFTYSGGAGFHLQIGLWFTLIVFAAMMVLYKGAWRSSKQRESVTKYFAEVLISIDGFETRCTGLIDTGNQLYDPLTRTPVMVMEASEWKDQLPESWMKRIREAQVEQIVTALGTDEFVWQDRLRLVPYRGVNKGTQFMLALKPDKVVITHNNATIEAQKVLIGLDGGKLCSDGSYQAIIHPLLVERNQSTA